MDYGMQVNLGYDGVRASEKAWIENKVSGENNRRARMCALYAARAEQCARVV